MLKFKNIHSANVFIYGVVHMISTCDSIFYKKLHEETGLITYTCIIITTTYFEKKNNIRKLLLVHLKLV